MDRVFSCDKCPKKCRTEEQLQNHKEKDIPCDFVCRRCGKKCVNRGRFDYHMKVTHPKKKVAEPPQAPQRRCTQEELDAVKQPFQWAVSPGEIVAAKRSVDIIPVQDFSKDNLDLFCRLINLAKEKNADVTVTIHPREEHAKRAGNSFITSDYTRTLQCLDNPNKINSVAANMLSDFHSDPGRPELHSIRLTDNARKIVKVYSRPEGPDGPVIDDAQCRWMPYAQQPLLKLLTEHASRLLLHAMAVIPKRLQYRYCVEKDVVCYCLDDADEDGNGNVILFSERGYDDSRPLILKAEFYQGKLDRLPEDDEEDREIVEEKAILLRLMKEQGAHVLKKLEELTLTEKDVMAFLERTRRLT